MIWAPIHVPLPRKVGMFYRVLCYSISQGLYSSGIKMSDTEPAARHWTSGIVRGLGSLRGSLSAAESGFLSKA